MTTELFALIDGKHVSVNGCDWVLWGPCGCPWGVSVARYTPTEEAAWNAFYERKRDRERVQRKGARLELMTHERWCREVADRMKTGCAHG